MGSDQEFVSVLIVWYTEDDMPSFYSVAMSKEDYDFLKHAHNCLINVHEGDSELVQKAMDTLNFAVMKEYEGINDDAKQQGVCPEKWVGRYVYNKVDTPDINVHIHHIISSGII